MFQEIRTQVAGWARQGWFPACWLFIGAVSAFDTYLIDRFGDVLASLEENPIGMFLIDLNDGNVSVFIRLKLAGTVLVMSVLAGLYVYLRRWSFPVTASIAAFQLGLLSYLILGSPPQASAKQYTAGFSIDASACVETFRDGIAAVFPGSDSRPLFKSGYRMREAQRTQNAGVASR